MSHSHESWKIDDNEQLPLAVIQDLEDGLGICEIGERNPANLANAERIVACVNAFKGMTTDEIKEMFDGQCMDVGFLLKSQADYISDLRMERDDCEANYQQALKHALELDAKCNELLDALKNARSVISSINYGLAYEIEKHDDDELVYWQRKEWCHWAVKEVLPEIDSVISKSEDAL